MKAFPYDLCKRNCNSNFNSNINTNLQLGSCYTHYSLTSYKGVRYNVYYNVPNKDF